MSKCLVRCLRTRWLAVTVQLALLAGASARADVAFTITPSSISNTYAGSITLQVTGLTNGETVVVQKFLDVNGDGVIDAGDWLVQQFTLTDGQPGQVIGGVTNLNVPGDGDAIAAQITAKYKFASGDFMQSIAGRYGFALSSPGGHFPTLTNFFTLTNAPYGQTLSGTVFSNGTAVPIPNAIVLLFPPPRPGKSGPGGSPLAGSVTDGAGNFSLQVPPGTYMPAAFKGGYVTDFSTVRVVTLGAGQSVTTNLTLAGATASLSGRLADAGNTGTGLPGVMVVAQTDTGLMGVGATDTNGSFTIGVQSSSAQWWLKPNDTSLLVHGYLGLQANTGASPGQSGLALTVPRATALFYGTVKDGLGNPLAGIDVYASSNDGQYQTDGYTDSKGNYFVGALSGGWNVQVSTDSSPTNYVYSQSWNQTLSSGQSVPWNFTALPTTGQISGSLKDNYGNPLANINVWANALIGGADFNQGNSQTDSSGNYSMGIANGTWVVGVNTSGGHSLPANYICSSNQTVVISNNNATATFTALLATNYITGVVLQSNGNPIAGLGIWGMASIGGVNYSVQTGTDGSGNYSLAVAAADWNLGVFCNGGGGGNWSTLDNLFGAGTYQCPANQMVNLLTGGSVANFSVGSGQPLQMTTGSLANGTVGQFYSQVIGASGGVPPYSWSIPNYSALPPANVVLSTNGVLSGTPMSSGTFYFYVRVTDALTNSADSPVPLMLIVNSSLQITNLSLRSGTAGVPYSAQLGATGGQSPYSWTLALGSASLPAGLGLSSGGLISGKPTTNGIAAFRVQVTDTNLLTASQTFSLAINPRPTLGSPAWHGNQFLMRLTGMTGQNYTVQMATSLTASNWTTLFVTNNLATNSFNVVDPVAADRQRFYRVEVGP